MEHHYEMLKDQVEFCYEQVENLQCLLNREVYWGRNHTVKQIRFDKYGHSNVTYSKVLQENTIPCELQGNRPCLRRWSPTLTLANTICIVPPSLVPCMLDQQGWLMANETRHQYLQWMTNDKQLPTRKTALSLSLRIPVSWCRTYRYELIQMPITHTYNQEYTYKTHVARNTSTRHMQWGLHQQEKWNWNHTYMTDAIRIAPTRDMQLELHLQETCNWDYKTDAIENAPPPWWLGGWYHSVNLWFTLIHYLTDNQ